MIDVGYAGTIGADRITHGEPLYGEDVFPEDNRFGDTYGPANYYAYVPFELALPWSGEWDELAASHAAAIVFDLATSLGLFFCRRAPAPAAGAGASSASLLAFAWLAYPYTDFALQSNSNDSLVAALLVWSLAAVRAARSPAARCSRSRRWPSSRPWRWRRSTRPASAACSPPTARRAAGPARPALGPAPGDRVRRSASSAASRCCSSIPAIDSGLATFFDRTVVSQIDRTSPFSIWGQVDGIQWLQTAVARRRRRCSRQRSRSCPAGATLPQVAALSAAVLIALQLSVDHWFYLYIPWFFGAIVIALLCLAPRDAAI